MLYLCYFSEKNNGSFFFFMFSFLKKIANHLNKHILLEHKMLLSCHYSCFDYCTGGSILHQKLNINFHIFFSGVSHSLLRRKRRAFNYCTTCIWDALIGYARSLMRAAIFREIRPVSSYAPKEQHRP